MNDRVKYQYTDEIYNELGYLATWLPGGGIELGDYGPIDRRLYTRHGSLKDRGFRISSTPQGTPLDIEFSSRNSVNVTIQLKGENKSLPNIPSGQAGIDLNFSRSGSCVLVLHGAVERTVKDLYQLQRDVLSFYQRRPNEWAKDYVVVSSAIEAVSASIIIADSTSSHYSVVSEGDIKAGLADLANASLNFSVTNSSDVSAKVLAQSDIRPFFRAFRIKDSWLSGSRVQTLGVAELSKEIGSTESPFEWANASHSSLQGRPA
jgi:hypothetical protein